MMQPRHWRGLLVRLVLFGALGWFYVAAATQHAVHVNWFKARGDQSAMLGMAEIQYHNWHGDRPAQMLPRSIMPLYPAYQALFYTPAMSDDLYFEVAKRWNIRLSVVLLVVLGLVFARYLPPLVSANVTLIVAFGYFVFKAGYVQPELLYYTLLFLTLVAAVALLREVRSGRSLALAAGTGVLAALTFLTDADVLPLIGVWLVAWGVGEIVRFRRAARAGSRAMAEATSIAGWRATAAAVFVSCFFLALLPYTINSKHEFGGYFYNANTSLYLWTDSWAEAATTLKVNGAEFHRLDRPDLPGPITYLRTHGLRQVTSRLAGGFANMLARSYATFSYLKYVAIYALFVLALIVSNRRAFVTLARDELPLFTFVVLYAIVFLLATAFVSPIAATGTTRYLIAHLTPFFFITSLLSALPPFRETRWTLAGTTVTTTHVHMLISVIIGSDIIFAIYPRLMTTYGGF